MPSRAFSWGIEGLQTLELPSAPISSFITQKPVAKFRHQSFLQIDDRPDLSTTTANMSAPQLNKIAANSPSRQNPSELELSIAGALYDLETNTADLKVALRPLQFVSAREVRNSR